jgi:hypothetical protein
MRRKLMWRAKTIDCVENIGLLNVELWGQFGEIGDFLSKVDNSSTYEEGKLTMSNVRIIEIKGIRGLNRRKRVNPRSTKLKYFS